MDRYTYKIVELLEKDAMIAIEFFGDPGLRWSYEIPLDKNGKPLTGEAFKAWVSELAFPLIERIEKPKPDLKEFISKEIIDTTVDISKEVAEIRTLKKMFEESRK